MAASAESTTLGSPVNSLWRFVLINSSYTYCCSCNLVECVAKFSTIFTPTVSICTD